jgi:hypothetical protein
MHLLVIYISMWRKEKNNKTMVLLHLVCLLASSIQMVEAYKDIIVEHPFYLHARIYDSQSAHVKFEIDRENNQRTCQMYKFTIRRNREHPYSMPEQNLTYWTNSLELKHLAVGNYRICAIICSEHIKKSHTYYIFNKKNYSTPITNCIKIRSSGSHFLILTLYILVVIILVFSQIVFTLRRRKVKARIKAALIEVENTIQKWRSSQASSISNENRQSCTILQNLITLPASPLEHSVTTSSFHPMVDEHRLSQPVIFHLENSNTHREQ